jgi:hypothetical protein
MLQLTQLDCMGARHRAHLVSSGLTLPQLGQVVEFGGTSWLQYLQGFL